MSYKFLFYLLISILLLLLLILITKNNNIENFNDNPKIAVISSIYGNYDDLKDVDNVVNKDYVDWYCFTDNDNKNDNNWKIITTPYHIINTKNIEEYKKYKNYYTNVDDIKTKNMMSAKYYKIKTHEIDILKKYDYYIWVDGSIKLRDGFINNIVKIIKENDINIINFKHSQRTNIKDETAVSNNMYKYEKQNLNKQLNSYLKDGFIDTNGLFELTIFVRSNDKKINNLFDLWWIQNLKFSYQDQVSYPYVLWKYNLEPDYIIKENVFNNEKFSYTEDSFMKNHNHGTIV